MPGAMARSSNPTPIPPGSPPAIWRSFERQAAWKNWVLVLQFAVIFLLCLAVIHLSSRPPEYVLVDAGGNPTFIQRRVATDALLRFLADRTRPPELEVLRFTEDFLRKALELSSVTVERQWPEALAMMAPQLRKRVAAEAEAGKLVELVMAAQVQTTITVENIEYIREAGELRHFRAAIKRVRTSVVTGGSAATDRLSIDVVERVVPPSIDRMDGLEVVEWEVRDLNGGTMGPTGGSSRP